MSATEIKTSDPIIQGELQAIAEQNGGVLPAKEVVEFARNNPRSALHARFEWDDSVAAERYRIEQARAIIASVTIVPAEGSRIVVRAWCNLPGDRASKNPAYRPTIDVMNDEEMRAQLLSDVLGELGRLRRKHQDLTELANVWAAVDAVAQA